MMDRPLSIGISPCPNDTFIFHGMLHGRVDTGGISFGPIMADVQQLNGAALSSELDVVKVSVFAASKILDNYTLLRAGGALGRGVGPLVVARPGTQPADLEGAAVAAPGLHTTGFLLFALWAREHAVTPRVEQMIFHNVMDTVAAGDAAAGVVIHEGRFTYAEQGLALLEDLGSWWERRTGLPLPLGAIAVRRSLGPEVARAVDAAIRASLIHARTHPEDSEDYIRRHAQELSPKVIAAHIDTFVTDYSLDVGDEGKAAVKALLQEASLAAGEEPPTGGVFFDD